MWRFGYCIFLLALCCLACDPESKTIEVQFEIQAEQALIKDTVYLAGNVSSLGNWNPKGLQLNRQKDLWTGHIHLDSVQTIEFKITKGDWSNEALSADGTVPDNYRFNISKDTLIKIKVPNWKDPGFSPPVQGQITGTAHYHRNIEASGLKNRDIIVWLPPDYEESEQQRYPVLYAHDGQNLFDPKTASFGVDWQLDEIADSLIRAQAIEPIIIVGINNTEDRSFEYGLGPKGDAYQDFITKELKPFIDAQYRTKPQAEFTASWGSSLGGLVSFILLWEHEAVFSKAACFSPAFIFPFQEKIINYVRLVEPESYESDHWGLYLDNGTLGVDAMLQTGVDSLKNVLDRKGLDYHYFFANGADHNESAWSKRTPKALLEFYSKKH